jgi:alpha-tubulin suppressor-like RCC1 family protein
MLDTRRSGVLIAVGALQLAACDPDWLEKFQEAHGGGHGPHGPKHPPDPEPPLICACPDLEFPPQSGDSCLRKASVISAGLDYSCAVLAGGSLKCWGRNTWYRLGYGPPEANARGDAPGELGNALPAIDLGPGLTATKVVADDDLTCAILQTGGVKCWGYGDYGTVTGAPGPEYVDDPISALPERTFGGRAAVEIAAGSGFAWALLDDGSIVRWGANVVDVPLGLGRVALSFGRGTTYDNYHLCAVLEDGSVACVGGGHAGQLGRDPALDPGVMPLGGYPLVALGTGREAIQLALGDAHSCALFEDGDVKCWGSNAFGQLGQDDTVARGLLPGQMGDALAPVVLGQPARAITAGTDHSCALLEDGSVKCWGSNEHGQLGLGHSDDQGDQPGEMASLASVDLGDGRTAVAIDGGTHTCALLDNGAVKCWGPNQFGQLGQGDTAERGSAPGQLGDALAEIDLGT